MAEPETNQPQTSVHYGELRDRATQALNHGQLHEAAELFEEAHRVAVAAGDQTMIDLAYCNRMAVERLVHPRRESLVRLQEILVRTTDPQVAFLTSYNLALDYDRPDGYRKSLFYARIALRYATELGDPAQQASAINQIGNALCAMSQFQPALEHFEEAETLLGAGVSLAKAAVFDNLGYCFTVLGDYEQGFDYLFRSLRMHRSLGTRFYELQNRLTLCFAYLHIGRPSRAAQHGTRALEIAEQVDDLKATKYGLLLLGEAYKMAGELDVAQECFTLLQETFYPEMPEVPGMLFGLDVCKMINLRA